MNFGQALEALKAGKRVKRAEWPMSYLIESAGEIWSYVDDTEFKRVKEVPMDAVLADDWIVVASPEGMSFSEAIKLLKDGKRVRRKSWMPEASIVTAGNTLWIYITHEKDVLRERWYPELESLGASDWQVVP